MRKCKENKRLTTQGMWLFNETKRLNSRKDTEELTGKHMFLLYYLYLTSLVHETLQHFLRCCKLVWIPSEIALPICVLNVKPDEVIGDVVLIKACIHRLHIFLVIVVPAALMVAEGSQGRERLGA